MVTTPEAMLREIPATERPSRVAAVAAVLGWLLVTAVVGSLYVGHSPSPYGVCQGRLGRPVPCELLHR
jgi:hypothetical protein